MDSQGTLNERRCCVLVLGMHRSGTSALAGALGQVGLGLPRRLLPIQPDNPKGHFEPAEIVALHDRILSAIDRSWNSWSAFPDDWEKRPEIQILIDELATCVELDFSESSFFVVKDPRICLLVPVWKIIAQKLDLELFAVLPFRSPWEVARSHFKRDGMPLIQGYLLWLRYVLEAEYNSRDINRIVTSYEALLESPIETVSAIVRAASIPSNFITMADASFVDPEMRNNKSETVIYPNLMRETFQNYRLLLENPSNPVVLKSLDKIRDTFLYSSDLFELLVQDDSKSVEALNKIEHLNRTIQALSLALKEQQMAINYIPDLLQKIKELENKQ